MKKILLVTAVMFMTALASSHANAELVLNTTNQGSFTFDPESNNGGSSFIVNGGNGLDDIAVYLGYRTGTFGNLSTETIQLTGGTASVEATFLPEYFRT